MATEIAHADGYRAAMNGAADCANPFLHRSLCWHAWHAGFARWHAGK